MAYGVYVCVCFYSLKVIPWFCIAQPFLRITLRHPRWRRFFTLAREGQTRAAFAELKLLFEITMPQIALQLPGLLSKNKKMKKNVRHPEVCSGVSLSGLRVVELNVLAEALDGGCEACGVALRLSDCIKETVSGLGSLLYICCSNSECGETNICRTNKTHRFRCLSSSLRSSSLHVRNRITEFAT